MDTNLGRYSKTGHIKQAGRDCLMDYSFYLKTNSPDFDKLKTYGFYQDGEFYIFQRDLSEADLYALIKISVDRIEVRVIDRAFGDDYIPFNVKDSRCAAKFEVEALLEDILSKCFLPTLIVPALTRYMEEKYGTAHEEPWDYLPGYYTFKAPNSGKWYAIIMHLPGNRIGLCGETMVDIINVKIRAERIEGLVDHEHYFPSYHMSKKNWITVLLNEETDMDVLKTLIDDSFQMVEKPRKAKGNWLVPANPKYYDIERAIAESPDSFLWKQSNSIKSGDIVFLYVAAPVSAIRYKCEVLKTDIPYDYADGNLRMSHVMELKLLEEYRNRPIHFKTLQKFGVRAVRGPRSVPAALLREIEKHGK